MTLKQLIAKRDEAQKALDEYRRQAEADCNFLSGKLSAWEEMIKEAEDAEAVDSRPRPNGHDPDHSAGETPARSAPA